MEKLLKNPMDRYIPSQLEVEQLCEQYRVGNLISIDAALGGLFNVNLKISTTTGQYVIRIHSGLSREDHLNSEKMIMEKLQKHGISPLMPLPTKEGFYFSKLHHRFVQITPFVQGIPFKFTKEQAYHCGESLKKFHQALMNEDAIPTPVWSNYPSQKGLEEGLELLRHSQKDLHKEVHIKEVEHLYFKVMQQWTPNEKFLKKSIIHGDWHPWNVLFNEYNEIAYILDFDFIQKGECLHDVAYFLWTIKNETNKEELGRHFIKGYGPLSLIEAELLPLAIARASLFFLCTASFVADPVLELQKQLRVQKPYIEWLLSADGKASIKNLLSF
ncbi:phosphotransferase [Lederbergia wuyishanensis]|uniref:Ser/Thr protein kinase RdoA (MazF antagonist) n=1 Tax=Lederbergia wuyishanensis TaxID=1347903 RepID=A0ABU0D226_9BACI|nr:phosphotransferase [Lederbergia wuyishanensis]MCJ8007382.1 phosphotransferase [Lederbergia wuyishanensis]MDQ0342451.1 Ser/Thr protein kinase RdoA (MazF antagonist) [Lederbergia wuyishanensis]